MKQLIALSLVIVLAACGGRMNYSPDTVEGAQCKKECSATMSGCQGKTEVCKEAAKNCMESCSDMEDLKD